jgi:hypothetical protein
MNLLIGLNNSVSHAHPAIHLPGYCILVLIRVATVRQSYENLQIFLLVVPRYASAPAIWAVGSSLHFNQSLLTRYRVYIPRYCSSNTGGLYKHY